LGKVELKEVFYMRIDGKREGGLREKRVNLLRVLNGAGFVVVQWNWMVDMI